MTALCQQSFVDFEINKKSHYKVASPSVPEGIRTPIIRTGTVACKTYLTSC